MTWSLSMIVKNGEEHLAQTLESAKAICDELVVLDTGSTDKTVEIAESFGAKVFHYDWIDDFGAARNASLSHCTGDWILWLDCGDIIPSESQKAFIALKENLATTGTQFDFVWAKINRGIDAEGNVVFAFNTPRLARRRKGLKWVGAVHEYLDASNVNALMAQGVWVDDPLALFNVPTDRNLKILQRLIDEGDTSTRTAYYYANELRDHKRWAEAIEAYNRFIAMEYYSWEYYDSLCSLARCHHEMKDEAAVGKVLAEAIRFDSTRGEAFVALGDMHYEQQRWAMAAPFYRAAIGLQAPVEGFSLPHVYTWLPKDRLAVCYGHLGMVKEASELTLEILSSCPETDRLLANLRMYGDALRRSSQP